MNVVDSSAWLSYFAGNGNAVMFSEPIEKLDELLVPSITITEVFKNVLRQRGEEAALIVTAHMEQGKVISLDSELAMNAAKFGVLYKLPLADSIIFATAKKYSAVLWTQDNDFEGLENVRYISKKKNT
ncbi:putative nucleic acid-binding protein [Marinobacter sp. LV10R520-4]|uniref:type II toxin-antitoxin system VapC family toxin n=1 Tax=Marinobacter sp. LV10R520-4 TaxID=1761796 RepID=UPI000BF92BE0|nr:type II toxin-antitoxin system VapC family toxin [Marinobacter sp. LV10R520-4]PFG52604.1 putative nucleic acid-binding protein [Marinobacter sp. LV10R520-4]